MCGINGIFSIKREDNFQRLNVMNNTLRHRGPDDEGVFQDGNIVLGQRRLMILDLSQAGHQPMSTPDGRFTMVFNGEVYNYREIREELDYPFHSQTDSEVVLAAWQKWGAESVHRFNGMFAFAVWDKKEQSLHLVRDRLGIKPLYWSFVNGNMIFSSEVRALLSSGLVDKTLDEDSLVDFLRYQTVQTPDTILKNVKMLKPGSILRIDTAGFVSGITTYWESGSSVPQFLNSSIPQNYEDVKLRVRELFYKSVERRLVSDVPFGAFLSGGIDSSAIVGAMAKVSNRQVKTFNISFAEEEFSEAKYARYIAEMHNTDHTEIKLSPQEFLKYLPEALKSMDHPSGDGPNTWLVSKVTKEAGITMALSGLGGDELFAGYPIFKRMVSLENKKWLWNLPLGLRKVAGVLMDTVKPGVASLKVKELLRMEKFDLATAFAISRQALMDDQIIGLLNRDILPEHKPVKYLKELFNYSFSSPLRGDKRGADIISNVSTGELTTYMQNVLLRDSDQMSMTHALEVRVPFLDHELVEYVLSLPDSFKYPATPKKLLVDSLNDILPDYIVNRPKMGFVFPWRDWLKNELHSFADERISSIAEREYFNKDEVLKLWSRFKQDDPTVTFSRIWPLIVLEEWLG